jgi:hypothetical protein
VWVATLAFAIYLLYPLGISLDGQWSAYLSYKIFNLARIPAALVDRQPPPPVSTITLAPDAKDYLLNSLWNRFGQYGTSYLLIVLAAIFMIVLGLRYRRQTAARYLVIRGAFSFVFGLLLGRVSDQYFYYLVVPSIIIAGYMLAVLVDKVRSSSLKNVPFFERRQLNFPAVPTYRTLWRPIFAVFAIMLLYNSFMWANSYVVQSDNAYVHVIQFVETHIPADASIESSDDVPVYYLPSSYTILRDRDTHSLADNHARYFIMSSKDAIGGYDGMNPEVYNWVLQHCHPLFEQNDTSFWKIGVYELNSSLEGQSGRGGTYSLLAQHSKSPHPFRFSTTSFLATREEDVV